MEIREKETGIVTINELQQEEWTLMPFGASQYRIVHKDKDKITFIATIEDSGDDKRNSAVATLLSKAPQLLQMIEDIYDGIKNTALGNSIIFYMIKKLLNEIKENECTASIRNA